MDALTLPGTLDSLPMIRDYVREIGEKAGLDRKALYRLKLAVDEIATNIVTHGYEDAGLVGDIVISSSLQPSALTIQLEDTSQEYNPYGLEAPGHLDKPISERPIGGLGVFLAVRGVDEFRYEYVNGRNLHTFMVKIPSSQPQSS
jgi:anti-sigma regulatory factor (Ser/Thr protein kinase)